MRQLGVTENNERIYELSASYGVDESGMIVEIDNGNDTFIFTKYYVDMSIKRNSPIDEYVLNLFDFTIDGIPYIQMINGSPEEGNSDLAEKIRKLPLKHQFFSRNPEAIVFIHIDGNSAIIKKDHRPKFHKDNSEDGNKKLISILKSISCQFGIYEDFEDLKRRKELDF
jgi:hypothetical protein